MNVVLELLKVIELSAVKTPEISAELTKPANRSQTGDAIHNMLCFYFCNQKKRGKKKITICGKRSMEMSRIRD